MRTKYLWVCLLAAALLAGCGGKSLVVKKSKEELRLMKIEADKARNNYRNMNYLPAAEAFEKLAVERTINQPLYFCELASIYLQLGDNDKAFTALLNAHESIDAFFDVKSEKKASSIWGKEQEKVFKGDPYERASLYTLLSLALLDRGDVDNALAATKTGLLADSDSEDLTNKADYGLLYLIAAKCHQLRGDVEVSQEMLNAAFKAFINNRGISERFVKRVNLEYNKNTIEPALPSARLAQLCSMASPQQLRDWCERSDKIERPDCIEWIIEHSRDVDPLDFNAMIVVWQGTPPYMSRVGQYGETRIINPGTLDSMSEISIVIDGTDYDLETGFSDINFQALTRGGRSMDEVLAEQAELKSGVNSFGDAMLQANTGDPYADLMCIIIGLIAKGTASMMQVEADVRCWQNLPHSFAVVPVKIAPGLHDAQILKWQLHCVPTLSKEFQFGIDSEKTFTVLHKRNPEPQYKFKLPVNSSEMLFAAGRTGEFDLDSNGEITSDEYQALHKLLIMHHDANNDGRISDREASRLVSDASRTFQNRMIIE